MIYFIINFMPIVFIFVSIAVIASIILSRAKRNDISPQSEVENRKKKTELEDKIEQKEREFQEKLDNQQSYTCLYCGTTYKGKTCPSCGARKKTN